MTEPTWTCQICGRAHKLVKAKDRGTVPTVIAHHGYQRPGYGWQTASCYGARYRPYEIACDAIPGCIDMVTRQREMLRDAVTNWTQKPPRFLTINDRWGQPWQSLLIPEGFDGANNPKDATWQPQRTYSREFWSIQGERTAEISAMGTALNDLNRRLREWKPQTKETA